MTRKYQVFDATGNRVTIEADSPRDALEKTETLLQHPPVDVKPVRKRKAKA
jgi:hypothetical protein